MLRTHFAPAITLAAALAFSASAQAPVDVRVALVIGNGAYPGPAALQNPANDARAMAEVLGRLGFQVVQAQDAGKAAMQAAIERTGAALKGRQGIAMFYYAGHGVQLDWRNYMVPVDARLRSAADVPQQALDIGQVVEAFRAAGTRLNIVVLDACRDNPFGSTGGAKGLAPLDAPPGTFLAFATAPGNVASDGQDGGNGLYTRYLVQELQRPQAKIEDVFKRVRLQVRRDSKGTQVPWESTSLEDDFHFDSGSKVASPAESEKARRFAEEKADWDRIKNSRNPDDFYAFLQKYPTGSASEVAQARLERLDVAKVQPQPGRDGVQQTAAQAWGRVNDRFTLVTRDRYSGAVLKTEDALVEKVDGDWLHAVLGGVPIRFAQTGEVAEASVGTFDPPIMTRPAGVLQVGAKFAGRSTFVDRKTGWTGWIEWSGRVVAAEKLTVPAGTFDTYKVRSELTSQSGLRITTDTWFVPGVPFSVRMDTERRFGTRAPDRESREMTFLKLGGG